jgi:hypothetical protein
MSNNIYKELKNLIDTERYFLICRKHYFSFLKKNGYKHEVSSTIENVSVSIILKDFVDYDYYEIETKLLILRGNDIPPVGYYRYIEDNEGNPVDDFWDGDFLVDG